MAKAALLAYYKGPSAHLNVTDPSTGQTYAIGCLEARGTVSCTGPGHIAFAFQGPPPKQGAFKPPPATPSPPSTSSSVEGPGSTSHATDQQFCSTHSCIANFPNGNGTIVQCNDGAWSHSGGLSGACSDHGGEKP